MDQRPTPAVFFCSIFTLILYHRFPRSSIPSWSHLCSRKSHKCSKKSHRIPNALRNKKEAISLLQRAGHQLSGWLISRDGLIMEQEFLRIVRVYEKDARRSGQKDVEISSLKKALNTEAKKHRQDVKLRETKKSLVLQPVAPKV